jgi:hypothetical protein
VETKTIRAVEMVRTIRDRMYEETKDLSPEDFLAFITREAAKATRDVVSDRHPSARLHSAPPYINLISRSQKRRGS